MAETSVDTRFEAQHERLLKAAAYRFNQKGYSGTSLKDVAKLLGLTDPAIYYYVRSKEELVYQCYVRAAAVGHEAMQLGVDEGQNGLEQIRAYLRHHIEFMVGERGPIAIMSEIPSLKPEHRDEVLKLSRRHSKAFEALIEKGIADASIAPCNVRMTGNAIMGAINWIPKWYRGDAAIAAEIVEEFPEILSRALEGP